MKVMASSIQWPRRKATPQRTTNLTRKAT